jgi:transcriptional antiterminator RfaH
MSVQLLEADDRVLPPFPEAAVGDWYVLHTKPQQEKRLGSELGRFGISWFLPLRAHRRQRGRRTLVTHQPMFPGYLFMRGGHEQLYRADRTGRVVRPLKVADQQRLDWELRNLHLALTGDAALDPYPYLRAGIRVEVRCGPFAGLQGVVESRLSTERLALQVDILGRAVSLELDGAAVEPID